MASQTATYPNLVYLRDKAVLFDESRGAFIMYGVQGRTWVALGDPVGPPDRIATLIRMFLERCDDYGGVPVFYEVGKDQLHRYADFGLTFVKLGEEARVDLSAFSLEGGRAAKHRQAIRYLEKAGATFRIVEPGEVPAIMDQLRAVSDAWLQEKSVAGKGLLARVLRSRVHRAVSGRGGREERRDRRVREHPGRRAAVRAVGRPDALPRGRAERGDGGDLRQPDLVGQGARAIGGSRSGWRRCPDSSARRSRRSGADSARFCSSTAEPFYNFQGLRAYKEKFHPAMGAALSRVSGRVPAAADPGGCLGAGRGRVSEDCAEAIHKGCTKSTKETKDTKAANNQEDKP